MTLLIAKYKKTELGEIPEDWDVKKLSGIGEIIGGGTPDTSKKDFWEKGNIAWAVPTDLTDLKSNYINRTDRYITKKGLENSAAKLLPVGTILITSRATIGECALNTIPMTTNQGFQSLICNSENNNLFFLYLIKFNKHKLIRKSHGTTFLEISKSNISSLRLAIPPLNQQQKIGSILSKVDGLIQKTDQIIDQTQRLKKGLMQRLLTKGIGHTKFKKTELGDIPEGWHIKYLGEYVDIMSGEYFAYSEFSKEGIPVLKIDNVTYGRIDWTTRTFLPEEYLKSHNHLVLNEGDIVLALNRPITNNQVKVGILSICDSPSLLYQRVGKFKFITNNLNNQFFFIYLSSPIFKKLLSKCLIGSDQPYVKTTELKRKKVAFPDLEEQKNISEILISITKDVRTKENQKNKLNSLKKALMKKLLTGKIRVKV